MSDDILVMYAGRCAEYGSADAIFTESAHPYTWGPLASMPRLDQARTARLIPIEGTPPSLINVPAGCAFHPRCQYAGLTGGRSQNELPLLHYVGPGHQAACHLSAVQRSEIRASSAVRSGHIERGEEL